MDFTPVHRAHVEKALADLDAGASPAGFRDSAYEESIKGDLIRPSSSSRWR
jgi:hypothetical protein